MNWLLVKNKFRKKVHNAENIERGDPLGFLITHSVVKLQKNGRRDPLGKFFSKKKSNRDENSSKGVGFGLLTRIKK